MRAWKLAAVLLLLTGCVNVSLETRGSKKKKAGAAPSATAPDTALAPAINAFAFDAYRVLATTQGNLIFSPLSIATVMASLTPGAAGATRDEMLRVLHLPSPPNDRGLMASLGESAREGGAAWNMANRAWVQSGTNLLPAFGSTARDHFEYDVGEADFVDSAESSRAAINQWVEQKTESRIKDLFPVGSINRWTRLALVNAIYFKGFWESQFEKRLTIPSSFHLSTSSTVDVPTMSQVHGLKMGRILGARVLELPYRGGNLSMLIILPDDVDGLPALEKRLSADSLGAWSSSLQQREVAVSLPRFISSKHFDLTRLLADMGMPSAFDATKADFSGITGRRDLFIGIVAHGAFIDVNEEGTEAAAATGVLMTRGGRVPEPFTADHPFFYLIRDRATGCILFMGRVVDPRS